MKVINAKQFKKLNVPRHFRHPLMLKAKTLKKGQGLIISKLEWTKWTKGRKVSYPPINLLVQSFGKGVFMSRKLLDGGWAILKIK